MIDVVIIGAGPAGSYLAWKLASKGYSVIALEEHAVIGEPVSCTGIISNECFERFSLSKKSVLGAARSAKLFSPSGREISMQKDEDQAFIVDRAAFDREIAEKARQAGASFQMNCCIEDIKVSNEGVSLVPRSISEHGAFHARAAVIATGFNSRLPELLGVGSPKDYAFGVQEEVALSDESTVELYFGKDVAPGFFAWLVPTSKDRGLAGLFSREKQRLYLQKFLDKLYREKKIAHNHNKVSFGGVPIGLLPRSYGERFLILGDAAGQVKPTTGGGIYYGLLCAEIAALTLDKSLKLDNLSARALRKYEINWKKVLGREIQIGLLARKIYQRLSDSQIEKVFQVLQATGLHNLLLRDKSFSFDWHSGLIIKALSQQSLGFLWDKIGIKAQRFLSRFLS